MTGEELITQERARHSHLGWTAEHDAEHGLGDLMAAAYCYAMTPVHRESQGFKSVRYDGPDSHFVTVPRDWPWAGRWWKPTTRERDLVKAGALLLAEKDRIAAEIDRLKAMEE